MPILLEGAERAGPEVEVQRQQSDGKGGQSRRSGSPRCRHAEFQQHGEQHAPHDRGQAHQDAGLQELELLVEAGLTPAEALQTATINPARFLGATDSLGSVEVGKVADLVLLEADPTAAIGNLRRVRGVVLAGRYLPRAVLDSLLAGVRERVALWRAHAPHNSSSLNPRTVEN